jgi:hypothetical protein
MLVYVNPDELSDEKKEIAKKHLRDALSKLEHDKNSSEEA